ncbi:MAG: sulfurtransferase [Gammaproteobacteria bacterium]|nr:sulfurtransferase [Gammaproteobacteria bacterium]MCW5583336.1 sulfurtransferase [Gammaproteobacteria bacterium]
MQTLNIAGYKFITLHNRDTLRAFFLEQCNLLTLKGTILLSPEGINVNLAGKMTDIQAFQLCLKKDPRFEDMHFHETYSINQPFQRLKVKLKKEIITLGKPEASPVITRAASITPEVFKQWLDEKRDITILDTRNDYEIRFGTFAHSVNLHMNDFSEFPLKLEQIQHGKPIVMFCTGGIRCEKAALYLLHQGYSDVYQLDGGILGYFQKVGGIHYQGECFVFDERISIDTRLKHTETIQCQVCQGPVSKSQQALSSYIPNVSCPSCINKTSSL